MGVREEEVYKMRYSAVTCDPDEFKNKGFTLRGSEWGRECELLVVGTMYNEDEVLFCRTFNSIVKNAAHLASRTKSKTWGTSSTPAWQKMTVVIVSDGRSKVNQRTLKVLGLLGVYQEGVAKDTIAGKDVQAHVFEYTTTVTVSPEGDVKPSGIPVQVIFCLKEQNKKKLNSHRWFFNAFANTLKPNVCVLIDVGTKPSGTSIYHLWKAFDKDKEIGGACGEICVDTGRGCGGLLNPLVAAQNFEYKMSNILDKPLESVFGYISVLPGAFSAYRYRALLNDSRGEGPLATYFRGEKFHEPGFTAGIFESNMYLAEDRVLCFEIVTKKHEAWKLKYVKSAKASTDVPEKVPEFISQRRRWLNGSFFAGVYAVALFYRIWSSGQSFFRKIWLQIEFAYIAFTILFTWIAPANFYLAFFFLTDSATSDPNNDPFGGSGADVLQILTSIYIGLLFVILVCALGNRPQGSNLAYTGVIFCFAIIFGITLYCAAWTLYVALPHNFADWKDFNKLLEDSAIRNILISILATYGLYIASSFLHFEPWHMFTSFIQYLFLLPSFVNVLGIYSMSNLHDVSWGTKGQSGPAKDLGAVKTAKGEKEGEDTLEYDMAKKEDIDAMWHQMRKEMGVKQIEVHQKRDADTRQKDHYANFRTNVVLLYLGTNIFLIIFFTSKFWLNLVKGFVNDKGQAVNPYMVFIFWCVVAGTSAFRFFGSVWYLILRAVGW
ncbi:glycosyltransferase family 2 protein [Atractiella rhizophila]|nr:glycosyltransferase family 2 protein [Atractiella rhizophila]